MYRLKTYDRSGSGKLVQRIGARHRSVEGTDGAIPRSMRILTLPRVASALLLACATALPISSARAQERVPLLQKKDLAALGYLLAATAATMPFDRSIAHEFADSALQANRTFHDAAGNLATIHERSLFVYSAIAWAGGRLFRSAPVADAGLHSAEAIAVGTAIGSFLKSTAGRARPRAANGDPFDFRFGNGYTSGDYRAFPSLHEIGSFAAASALTAEVARHHPRAGRVVGVVAYGGAGLVGAARMYGAEHWASDVVLGGGLGILIGRRIVAHAHSGDANSLDRFLLGGLSADANGMRIELLSKDF